MSNWVTECNNGMNELINEEVTLELYLEAPLGVQQLEGSDEKEGRLI